MWILLGQQDAQEAFVKFNSEESSVVIGSYTYINKVPKRVLFTISPFEVKENDLVLTSLEEQFNWVNWKIEDKFWNKVWE